MMIFDINVCSKLQIADNNAQRRPVIQTQTMSERVIFWHLSSTIADENIQYRFECIGSRYY